MEIWTEERVFCGGPFSATPMALDLTERFLAQAHESGSGVYCELREAARRHSLPVFDIVKRLPVLFDHAIQDHREQCGTEAQRLGGGFPFAVRLHERKRRVVDGCCGAGRKDDATSAFVRKDRKRWCSFLDQERSSRERLWSGV